MCTTLTFFRDCYTKKVGFGSFLDIFWVWRLQNMNLFQTHKNQKIALKTWKIRENQAARARIFCFSWVEKSPKNNFSSEIFQELIIWAPKPQKVSLETCVLLCNLGIFGCVIACVMCNDFTDGLCNQMSVITWHAITGEGTRSRLFHNVNTTENSISQAEKVVVQVPNRPTKLKKNRKNCFRKVADSRNLILRWGWKISN